MPRGVHKVPNYKGCCGINHWPPVEERFWSNVEKTDGCWEWQGTTTSGRKKYGVLRDNYKQVRAHRFSWELVNGPIPDGQVIRHMCDNKLCVNPDHLKVGTVCENNQDKTGKHKFIPVLPDKYEEALALLMEHGYASTQSIPSQ